jgi:hypothetical protein
MGVQNRRSLLETIGTVGTIIIAGCSSNDTSEADGETSTPEPEASSDTTETDIAETETSDQPTEQAESQSPTETPSSELIDLPIENMALSVGDLPGDGWNVDQNTIDSDRETPYASKFFSRENTQGNTEQVAHEMSRHGSVSDAKESFNSSRWSDLVGPGEPTESQDLAIGSESTWLASDDITDRSGDEPKQANSDLIVVRERNVVGFIQWFGGLEATADVGLDEMRSLAETLVRKWG